MGDRSAACFRHPVRQDRRAQTGLTLLEMMAVLGMCGILAAIAFPAYVSSVQRAKVGRAKADIAEMANVIGQYASENSGPPAGLGAVNLDSWVDPWGRAYVYLSFAGLKGKGKMRKDKNLNPLNTQYDLYSLGKDGLSKLPLTVPVSKDDVILAFDGNFIGLASDF